MNSLLIDFNILKELNITFEEYLFILNLYSIQNNNKILINNYLKFEIDSKKLEKSQFIKIIDNNILLRQKSLQLIENSFSTLTINKNLKTVKKKLPERLLTNIVENNYQEFREKWRGLKEGSMGAPKSCKEKLRRWIIENPEYSIEDIMKAADLYIKSLQGNYKFIQRADYFIFKKEGKEESSRLSAFIDEINNNNIQKEDWTSEIN